MKYLSTSPSFSSLLLWASTELDPKNPDPGETVQNFQCSTTVMQWLYSLFIQLLYQATLSSMTKRVSSRRHITVNACVLKSEGCLWLIQDCLTCQPVRGQNEWWCLNESSQVLGGRSSLVPDGHHLRPPCTEHQWCHWHPLCMTVCVYLWHFPPTTMEYSLLHTIREEIIDTRWSGLY